MNGPATDRGVRRINEHIQANFQPARDAMTYLVLEGFTVLEVKIGSRRPRITLKACPKCASLNGAIKASYEDRFGLAHQVWVADSFGCQVEWKVERTIKGA